MRVLSSMAALLLAVPALAQTKTTPTPQAHPTPPSAPATAAAANAATAKRAYDIASANLDAAKAYLGGLNDLAQKAETWDRDSSISLFNSAQRAVTDAEERVGALVPLAKGDWAKASDSLGKARSDLVRVQSELKQFAGSVRSSAGDAAARQGEIKGLWTTLDTASKDLNSAASQMSVDTHLKTP